MSPLTLLKLARTTGAVAIGGAILAAGITARAEYDAEADELRLSIGKVRPLVKALRGGGRDVAAS